MIESDYQSEPSCKQDGSADVRFAGRLASGSTGFAASGRERRMLSGHHLNIGKGVSGCFQKRSIVS
jgi:hypothetical protein